MASGEFEAGRNMKNIAIVVVIICIVIGAGAIYFLTLPSGTGVTLVILTRHDVAIHNAYEDPFLATEFAQENNIIDIQWKTQDAGFWDDVIEAGGVDVLWGGGPTLFDNMQRGGYLLPLTSEKMLAVIDRVEDEIAGADSTFGFTINTVFLDEYDLPRPNNWTHLAQPIWGSLLPTPTIAMGNAPKTTSNTRIYEIITQGMGWDKGWVTMARMAGSARLYQGSVETQAAAENGDVGVSMSIDFYGYNTQANNPNCEYVLPEGETIVNGDPIAICANTEQQDLAEGFLDFVLSAEGQSLWFTPGVRRMPVMEEAFDTPAGEENEKLHELFLDTLENQGIDFNDSLSLLINTAFIYYFEAVFNNAHDQLVAAWSAIVEAYYDEEITLEQLDTLATTMGTPVTVTVDSEEHKFTLDYAIEINDDMYYNSDFLNDMQTLWRAAAIEQYQQALDDLAALTGS
jgi:ABC-type Fe3+ transport system substrate-binding protein